ncbi:hypothetical protein [Pseudacidovorax intermedius]|uniref:hypothetical protein n=1 Tax=Pseudacidovorax intermedius TaxID=433924 RepID=UPI0026ECD5BB|nr:hypothetical protein [Pseudacidovorax intermedius]
MKKRKIDQFGKIFEYLKNPEIREKETGKTLLTVDGAIFRGITFEEIDWINIVFKNCDFFSNYEIGPNTQTNVRYEDCRFSGILSFGKTRNVRFLRCTWAGAPVMFAEKGSTDTVFESCTFIGKSPDPNQQGGVGSHGEAEFVDCYAKWFSLVGDASLALRKCECEGASIETDSEANSGDAFLSSKVVIQQSKLRGYFDMRATSLHSLSIQDTVMEYFDISRSKVKENVLIERVRGGYLNASAHSMGKLTISQCQILGRRKNFSFEVGMDSAEEVLIEHCNFGTDPTLSVGLGAGRPLEPNEWSTTPKNKYALIRNSTLPVMDASWLESRHLRLENNTISSVDISNSRIGKLELSGNTISREVNLKGTHVKESKIQPLTKSQAKLDGSNIKLN